MKDNKRFVVCVCVASATVWATGGQFVNSLWVCVPAVRAVGVDCFIHVASLE